MTEQGFGKMIEAEKLIGSAEGQLLLRAEALVPGAGREEVEVLLADAICRLMKTEVQSDRVIMEGEVKCQAAYRLGSEKNAKALTAKAVMSHIFDVKGAVSGMRSISDARVEDVTARYENGHMMFDIALSVSAQVSALTPIEVLTEADVRDGLEVNTEEITSVKTAAENSAVVIVSDKTALPASLDARYAIMEWAAASDMDYTPEPGGIRVTGSVFVETLVSGGLSSRPAALIKYTLPVDKFMEMPEWLVGNITLDAQVLGVSTEVDSVMDMGDSTLRMEAEVEITARAAYTDRVKAVTDVFSADDRDVSAEENVFEICAAKSVIDVKEPFRASVLLPEGAGAVGAVCAVKTRASVADVRTENGKSLISGIVNAQVIYMPQSGEKLMSAKGDLPFEIPLAAPLSDNSLVRVEALNAEGSALMSDRVEVKCVLNVKADKTEREEKRTVSKIEEAGENKRRKGCVIVWPKNGDDAWSVAKRYRVPVEEVKNASEDGVSAGNPIVLRI